LPEGTVLRLALNNPNKFYLFLKESDAYVLIHSKGWQPPITRQSLEKFLELVENTGCIVQYVSKWENAIIF
jgi:hypothetical protein